MRWYWWVVAGFIIALDLLALAGFLTMCYLVAVQ